MVGTTGPVVRRVAIITIFTFLTVLATSAGEPTGSRFAYLDVNDPYYPDGGFPKLTTPMWVGEEGVDAVVCLTIDDMCKVFPEGERPKELPTYARSPQVYFDFLKPAIARLQKIDGRAPISPFCLRLDPDDKLVRHMQEIGMSMECHTWTHPVPLMRTVGEKPSASPASLQPAIDDTLLSLANLSKLNGLAPVAQRNPGCDGRNTASPRMFAEIFPMRTAEGDFLRMDSSIFTVFTQREPGMPKEWFEHKDGRKRFGKFVYGIPYTKTYRNYVADYPYPFVINRTIWELPAVVPGDAHGVHANGKMSDKTVEDWKRAVDIVVAKKGLYTLCFHPHGYIAGEQVADLIDYADNTYGKRIKFLNCREIYDRLTNNMCKGVPLRDANGADNHVRLADVNGDGYIDVLLGTPETRVWNPQNNRFDQFTLPVQGFPPNIRLFTAARDGRAGLAVAGEGLFKIWSFNEDGWMPTKILDTVVADLQIAPVAAFSGYCFRDLNGDGVSDLIKNNAEQNAIYLGRAAENALHLNRADFALPRPGMLIDKDGKDAGLRFVDLDGDGDDDLVFSNEKEYGVWRFDGVESGWVQVRSGAATDPDAIPSIVEHGRNHGVWFHSGEMIQANEFTAGETDLIRRVSFGDLLKPSP